MVRGGFCQRSQFRGVEPAIGVRRGNVNVFRGDDQERPARGVRYRIDFLALADAQCRAAKQEERDVCAKPGGNIEKQWHLDLLPRKLQVTEQRRSRITGAAAQSAAGGNFLLQDNFHAGANPAFAAQGIYGAIDEILFDFFLGEGFVALNLQRDARAARSAELYRVMQPNRLKNGA